MIPPIFFILAPLISAQVLRPAPLPPWTQCMEYSFAYPGWIIHDIKDKQQSSGSGKIQFKLLNTAINHDANCLFSENPAPESWITCDADAHNLDHHLSTLIRIDGGLHVNQTWKCPGLVSDNPIIFNAIQANKSTDLFLSSLHDGTASTNITIPARLITPVDMQPEPPVPSINHNFPGCITTSSSPPLSWSISNTQLRWKPAGPGLFASWYPGSVIFTFDITNPANDYSITCNRTYEIWGGNGQVDYFNLEDVSTGNGTTTGLYYCENRGDLVNGKFAYPDRTLARLDFVNIGPSWGGWGVISVGQTWYCDDDGAEKPYIFSAFGTLNLTNWSCSNATDPQGYTSCSYLSISLPATITNHTSLPPYELTAGPVSANSCTAQSFNSSSVLLTDIYINEKFENNTDRLILRFSHSPSRIDVQALGYLINNTTSFGWESIWYSDPLKNAAASRRAGDLVPGGGSFTRIADAIVLNLNFSWICNDECSEDECRITFTNSVSTTLSIDPDTKYRETGGWDYLLGRSPQILVPWSNTTWKAGRP